MNQSVVFEYSPAFIPLCILLGLSYALILYYRNRKENFSTTLHWTLGISRMIVVALIAFLLLGPSVRSLKHLKEKPILIVAADNSQSLVMSSDSAWYRNVWPGQLHTFIKQEEDRFEVRPFVFGDKVEAGNALNYQDPYTDYSGLFDMLESNFSHRNVGAVVIASDGIVNRGTNPLNMGNNIDYPVYTLALGDTALRKDVIINKINFNQIAYLDNSFPVEIIVNGKKMAGETCNLKIIKDGKIIHEEKVVFKSEDDYENILVRLKAEKTGTQRYTVQLSKQPDEVSFANNHQDFFIDILDGKQKILILANSPHPDISAIEQSLSTDLNFTTDVKLISDFDGKAEDYNLIILHGLPSKRHPMTSLIKEIEKKDIPLFFILSEKTDLAMFNGLETGLQMETKNVLYNEAFAKFNPGFSAFQLPKDAGNELSSFPPLYSPYSDMDFLASSDILMYQQVGSVATENPLLIFTQAQNRKIGILLGEGIWRWRLTDFAQNESHQFFDGLIKKVVRYLTIKVDKSLFRVYCKNSFDAGNTIEFTAEVYNESYELINEPDVRMDISGSDGRRYPFDFVRSGESYYLNAGNLPVDNYTYQARAKSGGKLLKETGEFTVKPVVLERINTVANHNLLYNLASDHGGKMYSPDQLKQLTEELNKREDIKTIVYVKKKFSELMDLPALLILIILLLSFEWFLRKRSGSY